MADNITVLIGGDISALRTAMAQAQQTIQQFVSQTQTMASATAATMSQVGSATAAGMNTARVATDDMITRMDAWKISEADMITRLDRWQTSAQSASSGINNVAASTDKAAHASTGFYRELIVLGHEMSQGNFSRFGGSLLVLAERMGNLESIVKSILTPMGAFVVLVGAAAAGLIAWAIHIARAGEALNHFQAMLATAGKTVDKTDFDALKEKLSTLPDVTSKISAEVLNSFGKMTNGSVALWKVMIDNLPALASRMDGDIPAAAKEMASAFDDPIHKGELLADKMGITHDKLTAFYKAAGDGNSSGALTELLRVVNQSAAAFENLSRASSVKAANDAKLALGSSQSPDFANPAALAGKAADIELEEAAKQAAEAQQHLQDVLKQIDYDPKKPPPTDVFKQKLLDYAATSKDTERTILETEIGAWRERQTAFGVSQREIEESKKEEAILTRQLDKLTSSETISDAKNAVRELKGTAVERAQGEVAIYTKLAQDKRVLADRDNSVAADLSQAQVKLAKTISQQLIDDVKTRNEQIAANDKLSVTAKLSAQLANINTLRNNDKIYVDSKKTVDAEYFSKFEQLTSHNREQAMAAAHEITENAKRGSAERVAAAQNELALAIKFYHQGSTEAIHADHEVQAARKEQLDLWVSDYGKGIQEQLATTRNNEQAKLQIVRGALTALAAAHQQDTELYKRLKIEELSFAQAIEEQKVRAAAQWSSAQVALGKGALEQKKSLLDLEVAQNKITEQQKFAALRDFETQAYNLDRNALLQQMSDNNASAQDKLKTYIEIEKLDQQHNLRMQQMQTQDFERSKAGWLQYTSAISGMFANAISGMILHTTTLRQAIANILTGMLNLFLNAIAQMVANWAAGNLANLGNSIATFLGIQTADEAAATTKAAAQTASNATTIAGNVAQAESYAALGAVEAASSVAAIPFVGWMMAPGVAAETYGVLSGFAALASLAVGAWNLPQDMPANLHAGEMVIPSTFAEGLRSGSNSLGGSPGSTNNGGGGGGDTYHFHINAIDARGVKAMFDEHGGAIVTSLAKQQRNLNRGMS